ncbi:DUF721 domain-containing protein [Patescibacteria group bacterium]|nr:MAG: DUF721 domain-containing protein [Patescibacteria group bacterium]
MAFVPLGSLLKKQIQAKPGVSGPVQASRVVLRACDVVTAKFPALAPRLTVVSFRDGVLTVKAASGAAAAETRLRETQLLAALRDEVGPGVVRSLRVRL